MTSKIVIGLFLMSLTSALSFAGDGNARKEKCVGAGVIACRATEVECLIDVLSRPSVPALPPSDAGTPVAVENPEVKGCWLEFNTCVNKVLVDCKVR